MRYFKIALLALFLSGCVGACGAPTAADPIERGLGYIAAAIVTVAILHAFLNK